MNRIVSRTVPIEVGLALDCFPPCLRQLLEFDVFNGDPVFAGIKRYPNEKASDGRSYRDTAHVCYPYHTYDGRTTVVLPQPIGVSHTVHELAHVLDYALDFSVDAQPVTRYAQTNRREAFAEFVTALLVPGYLHYDPRGERYVASQRRQIVQLGMQEEERCVAH